MSDDLSPSPREHPGAPEALASFENSVPSALAESVNIVVYGSALGAMGSPAQDRV